MVVPATDESAATTATMSVQLILDFGLSSACVVFSVVWAGSPLVRVVLVLVSGIFPPGWDRSGNQRQSRSFDERHCRRSVFRILSWDWRRNVWFFVSILRNVPPVGISPVVSIQKGAPITD